MSGFFRRRRGGAVPVAPKTPEQVALEELRQLIGLAEAQLETIPVMENADYKDALKRGILAAKTSALTIAVQIKAMEEEPYSGDLEMEEPPDVITECMKAKEALAEILHTSLASPNRFDGQLFDEDMAREWDDTASEVDSWDDAASEGYHSVDVPVPRATIHQDILTRIEQEYGVIADEKKPDAFIITKGQSEGLSAEEPQVVGLLELHKPDTTKETSTLFTTKFKRKQKDAFFENAKLMLSVTVPIMDKDAARRDQYTFTSGIRTKDQARQVMLAYVAIFFDKMNEQLSEQLSDWRTITPSEHRDIFAETAAYITFKADPKSKQALAQFFNDDKLALSAEGIFTEAGTQVSVEDLTLLKKLLAVHFGVGLSPTDELGPNQMMCAKKGPKHGRVTP